MDYAQWCKSPQLQAELREILNHPTVKIALAIAKDTGLPKLTGCPFENCTLIEWQAIKASYSQGYFDHENNLIQLAYVPDSHVAAAKAESKPVLGPWEYGLKKEPAPLSKPLKPAPPSKNKPPRQKPSKAAKKK